MKKSNTLDCIFPFFQKQNAKKLYSTHIQITIYKKIINNYQLTV